MKIKLPPYDNFPVCSDDRVSLRDIKISDIPYIIDISYYDGVKASNLDQAIQMQDGINKDYKNGESLHWGIVELQTNKIVGTCGFYRGFGHGEGELGCVLLPTYRGRGFMSSALKLSVTYGFDQMGLHRIWARTTVENDKAINLLANLGFVKAAESNTTDVDYELRKVTELGQNHQKDNVIFI